MVCFWRVGISRVPAMSAFSGFRLVYGAALSGVPRWPSVDRRRVGEHVGGETGVVARVSLACFDLRRCELAPWRASRDALAGIERVVLPFASVRQSRSRVTIIDVAEWLFASVHIQRL